MQGCGACYSKLPDRRCPLARCRFDAPPRRNITVEKLIADCGMVLDCDNADYGCGYRGAWEALEEHVVECPNREVLCPATDCQERVRLSELAGHFATSPGHNVEERFGSGYIVYTVVQDRNADWGLSTQQIDGATFFEQVVAREGTWFAWVKVKGGAMEAARWTCDVSAQNEGFAAKSLEVHSIDRTVEEILESGQYLALTRQQVRNILCIHINYMIKKK